ncbi:MAG: Calx-beta domain-containing protein, partial [Candidatus Thiodiazotropha sp.]
LFSESAYSVDETTDKLVVTVRRLGGSAGEVSVDYRTLADQASDGRAADFVAQSGSLTFADGETIRSFEVGIIDDDLDEENESFYLSLDNPGGSALLSNQPEAVVPILDDDGPGVISFGAVNYAVNESHDRVSLGLVRSTGSEGAVSVEISLVDDSARVDSDYLAPVSETVHFASGEISKEITIPLVKDQVHEGNESFDVLLSVATGGARVGEPASTRVTILDDDPDRSITSLHLDAVNYLVGESAGEVRVTVLRSGNVDRMATVEYETLAGSAKAGEDFVTKKGSLLFRPKVTSKSITIPIKEDGVYEKESSFTLVLSGVDSGSVLAQPAAAIVRISDNDAQPYVSLGSSGSAGGYISGGSSADLGGMSGGEETERKEQEAAPGGSLGGLRIFDLNLRGYSGAGEDELRRLQTLDGSLPQADASADGAEAGDPAQSAPDCSGEAESESDACKLEALNGEAGAESGDKSASSNDPESAAARESGAR